MWLSDPEVRGCNSVVSPVLMGLFASSVRSTLVRMKVMVYLMWSRQRSWFEVSSNLYLHFNELTCSSTSLKLVPDR